MPWSLKYSPERRLIIQRFWGDLELRELDQMRAERRDRGIPYPVESCIADMRGASFLFELAELKEHEAEIRAADLSARRMAYIATEAMPTAMGMIWARMVDQEVEVQVFSTEEAAYAWLGVERRPRDLKSPASEAV